MARLEVAVGASDSDWHLAPDCNGDLVHAPEPIVYLRPRCVDHHHSAWRSAAGLHALNDAPEGVVCQLLLDAGANVANCSSGLIDAVCAEPQARLQWKIEAVKGLSALVHVLRPAVGHHDLCGQRLRVVHAQCDAAAGALRPRLDEVPVEIIQIYIALRTGCHLPCGCVPAGPHELVPLRQGHGPLLGGHVPVALANLGEARGQRLDGPFRQALLDGRAVAGRLACAIIGVARAARTHLNIIDGFARPPTVPT
mmetsp:Transcript_51736/g.150318  ORF Transcript_51736/g.150318 Transcript_51736/m.150318 type:complete len:253 (-) Transcript_51736:24-782(-)